MIDEEKQGSQKLLAAALNGGLRWSLHVHVRVHVRAVT